MSPKFPKSTSPSTKDEIYALLERHLIEEYLKSKGYSLEDLKTLPEKEVQELKKQASTYASGKLSEIENRARFAEDLHRAGHSLES